MEKHTGNHSEPRVKEVMCVVTSTTFVPLLYTHMVLPAGTATPVPVVFLTVTVSARPLLMMYGLSIWHPEPSMRLRAPPLVPVRFKRRCRADWVPLVLVSVSVTSLLEKATSADPTMASSMAVPRLALVVDPHVPTCSPVPISSIFKSENVDAMIYSG